MLLKILQNTIFKIFLFLFVSFSYDFEVLIVFALATVRVLYFHTELYFPGMLSVDLSMNNGGDFKLLKAGLLRRMNRRISGGGTKVKPFRGTIQFFSGPSKQKSAILLLFDSLANSFNL